jgi:hypothetical protein
MILQIRLECTWTSPDRPCFSQLPVAFQLPVTTQRKSLEVPIKLSSCLGVGRREKFSRA